ncbi:MAG: nucleoside deaminase [Bacilli bacterium]|nr:nucleoside deaminase [Bacilli bacterium]MDD4282699.1 nucleoside deaminase [Bacilli bacterium]MDD4718238.1 nucleoside deaminase [Bacilli bacterium]
MEYKYMKLALEEAKKSILIDDVPVGAVIVKDNKVIAKAYNKKECSKIATDHAEILAIKKACKKMNTWRLEECTIYVTLEPCLMCYGAILQARIPKIVYSTPSPKYGFTNYINKTLKNTNKIVVARGIYEEKSQKMLKEFFGDKRN